jgi:hypothetical protein
MNYPKVNWKEVEQASDHAQMELVNDGEFYRRIASLILRQQQVPNTVIVSGAIHRSIELHRLEDDAVVRRAVRDLTMLKVYEYYFQDSSMSYGDIVEAMFAGLKGMGRGLIADYLQYKKIKVINIQGTVTGRFSHNEENNVNQPQTADQTVNVGHLQDKAVSTMTLIYGVNSEQVTAENVFAHITRLEGEQAKYAGMKNKPAALRRREEELQAEIDALVKFSDEAHNPDK